MTREEHLTDIVDGCLTEEEASSRLGIAGIKVSKVTKMAVHLDEGEMIYRVLFRGIRGWIYHKCGKECKPHNVYPYMIT